MLNSIFKKSPVIVLFFVVFISQTSYGQWKFADSINMTSENYSLNFNEINDIVKKKYSHLKRKKIDLDALFSNVNQKISVSKTKEEYFQCLLYYFSELKNSHSRLFLDDYGINCSAKLIQNRLFLERIEDNTFIENGIQFGDEIVEIDHIQMSKWLESQLNYISSSTYEGDINAVVLFKVFSSTFKDVRTYSIKTSSGIKQVKVNLVNPADYSHLLFRNQRKASGKILNKETAYIEIKSMTGKVVQDFIKVYDTLNNYPNLIIDIRRNSGGNSDYSEQIASYLIHKRMRACVSRKKINPKPNSYKGNIYVLTDVFTGSAAESFALDLHESGNVVLVGSQTNGDTGNLPKVFTTSFGLSFSIPIRKPVQISFKEFPMEGIGIPPHHSIEQTIKDYVNNIDTVLEYTLNLIEK
ncbi:S41 family peptidase [uncultured Psychroserpens sp.]|uniref:S41 family peptidase n=1 Tax=uncultured Psychroserpens sp. TaxID=255436 RepID=UPI00261636B3|nr:S41 family peptidase [uncultured Psychroserpens sp.]